MLLAHELTTVKLIVTGRLPLNVPARLRHLILIFHAVLHLFATAFILTAPPHLLSEVDVTSRVLILDLYAKLQHRTFHSLLLVDRTLRLRHVHPGSQLIVFQSLNPSLAAHQLLVARQLLTMRPLWMRTLPLKTPWTFLRKQD